MPLNADCYPVHGTHVSLAGNDALAAALFVIGLTEVAHRARVVVRAEHARNDDVTVRVLHKR